MVTTVLEAATADVARTANATTVRNMSRIVSTMGRQPIMVKPIHMLRCFCLIALLCCPSFVFPQTLAVEKGRAIYRSNCAFCHGITGLGGRGPDLVGGTKKTDTELRRIIRDGVPGTSMPAFKSLAPEETVQVVGF